MRLAELLRVKGRPAEQAQEDDRRPDQIEMLPICRIRPNRFQPRKEFAEESLQELADSIKEHGILHPIVVTGVDDGYELVVGERRLRACRQLGWDTIPALVRELGEKEMAELALIENLQRRDLDFFEEAEGYRRLLEEFQVTQDELAARLSRSQSSIANRLRLLKLDPEVRQAVFRCTLSERHARALLKLGDKESQIKVIETIAEKALNVRQTEELIGRMINDHANGTVPERRRKIIFKDIRLFTNSLKELTESLHASGLEVRVDESDEDDYYRVTVMIRKPQLRRDH